MFELSSLQRHTTPHRADILFFDHFIVALAKVSIHKLFLINKLLSLTVGVKLRTNKANHSLLFSYTNVITKKKREFLVTDLYNFQ